MSELVMMGVSKNEFPAFFSLKCENVKTKSG